MFVHLRGHSTFSMLEGIGSLYNILARVKELGQPAVALTDYHGMYGVMELYQKAKWYDVKPILGVEMQCVYDRSLLHGDGDIGTVVLLARDLQWYQNLLPLISKGYDTLHRGHPTIDFSLLEQYHAWLYVLLGGDRGFFGMMIQQNEQYAKLLDLWKMLQKMFGAEYVLADLIVQDYRRVPQLRSINATIQKLAEETHTMLLVHTNFHYVLEKDAQSFEVALAIKDTKKMYDEHRRKVVGQFHIMSEQEIVETMRLNWYEDAFIHQCMAHNCTIADTIDVKIQLWQSLFPEYANPPEIQKLYEANKKTLIEWIQ